MFPGLLAGVALTPAFGAEELLGPPRDERSWHHRRMSREAALAAGWSAPAAAEVGWHADAIDRILHDPFWLAAGGLRRLRTARTHRALAEQVHVTDLPTAELVSSAWVRLVGGTGCALRWAATLTEPEAIAVVRGAVGLGFHALQDFYSHSTWIDEPARRAVTWQEADAQTRAEVVCSRWALPGQPRHGEFGLRLGRAGHARVPAAIPLRGAWSLPAAVAGLDRGINLDSRWQAPVAVTTRGLDLTAEEAFDVAAGLAVRSSLQVLEALADDAERAGLADLWAAVAQGAASPGRLRDRSHHDPALMPLGFLAAGARAGVEPAADTWFERGAVGGDRVGDRATGTPRVRFRRGPVPEVRVG